MKKIGYILISFCLLLFSACQEDESMQGGKQTGYLRLSTSVNMAAVTKAEAELYNPKQLAVQILNAEGEVVKETQNYDEEWKDGEPIEVPVGAYTIKASSAGFDGETSAFDKPYYAGSTSVEVQAGKTANATITCTLANVKVTVNFDQSFKDAFSSATVQIDDNTEDEGIAPLKFEMGKTSESGYFPVTDLVAVVAATNKEHGVTNTQRNVIEGVKARDHYILNYKVGESTDTDGEGNISITVDETTRTYTYTVIVSTAPKPILTAEANAWAKMAYLEGSVNANGWTLEDGNYSFEYRQKDAADWQSATATLDGETYKAQVTGLTPAATYEYRLVYRNGEENYEGATVEFTTEEATELYNGGFEFWCTASEPGLNGSLKNVASPNKSGTLFWDTSNPGANTLGENNPTNKVETPVQGGTYAAQLKSISVFGQLAAASLYTGKFIKANLTMDADMQFGQPFTGRPIALKGYYKYTPVPIDIVKKVPEGVSIVKNETLDECSIYIALATEAITFNNSETVINYETDNRIIAYGALPSGAATEGDGYTEFTIPLQYKESKFDVQPTHIIVVCSASKYGDYMTGGEGSTLYVDEFSLVYDGTPTIWEGK